MTHRIIPHPHEARRFLEAGSVLIVREVEPQPVRFSHVDVPYWQWTPDAEPAYYGFHALIPQVVWRDGLNPFECGAASGMNRLCPFHSPGDEVWFCNCDQLRCPDCGRVIQSDVDYPNCDCGFPVDCMFPDNLRGVVVSRECRRVGTITELEAAEAGHEPLRDAGDVLEPADEVFWEWWNFELKAQSPYESDPWAWVVRVERTEAST